MEKSEQNQLLDKMLSFYKKRYTGKELETKFNNSCEDIINSGDLSHSNYISFCMDNDIEPIIKKKSKSADTDTYSSYGSGCGSSRSYGYTRGC